MIESPSATAVRVSLPEGASVVAATGPVNQAIDGRFFLARFDDLSEDEIKTICDGWPPEQFNDRGFTIENASP